MHIHFLGAHNIESQGSRHVCLLLDEVLAIDAGALTASLSFSAQQKLRAILLTHQHYDHIRDIPAIGMSYLLQENTMDVYSTRPVYEVLSANLLNDGLYPNFLEKPPGRPAVRFNLMEPGRAETICGYTILPVPVNHSVPTVGYQITSSDGKTFFYTSDTGPGLAECWRQVSPELLIIEVTALNKYEDYCRQSGHLTASLLQPELESFRLMKGYLPQVVLVHMNPLDEKAIEAEVAAVAGSLNTSIRLGYEGMEIDL